MRAPLAFFLLHFTAAQPPAPPPTTSPTYFCPTSCSNASACFPNIPVDTQRTIPRPPTAATFSIATNAPTTWYANNARCTFSISNPSRRPLQLSVSRFSLESCCDKLFVRLDGGPEQQVTNPVNPQSGVLDSVASIDFRFSSDSSVQSSGVQITVTTSTMGPPSHSVNDDPYYGPGVPCNTLQGGGCEFAPNPAMYAAGSAASIIVSLACCAGALAVSFRVRPAPPASAAAKTWQPRALRAFPLMMAAHCLLVMGTITGIASLSIVIATLRSLSGSGTYGIRSYVLLAVLSVPTAFSFIGLICLVLPSAVLSGIAAVRLRQLAVGGAMPAACASGCCCAPSAPAIQGLAWSGVLLYFILGLSTRLLMVPGLALDVFSVICLLVGCVLASVSGCCAMGPLPGLGAGRANLCCAEPAVEEGEGGTLAEGSSQAAIEVGVMQLAQAPPQQLQMRAPQPPPGFFFAAAPQQSQPPMPTLPGNAINES